MSGADHFRVVGLNPYSSPRRQPDVARAISEHAAIRAALREAGVRVADVTAPAGCQDGVFTANWALVRGDTAVISRLPPQRRAEQRYAQRRLRDLGFRTVTAPYRFSGQGDALPAGNLLFVGSTYRTDPRMHQFLAERLGFEVIGLQTEPARDEGGRPLINSCTGWPDSLFYDLDLAISVIRPDLIAWCPAAFTPGSRARMRAVPVEKIEVSLPEALRFACNLFSTGRTVVMGADAPDLRAALEARGLTTVTPTVRELGKGGGYIRCTTLTLDNR